MSNKLTEKQLEDLRRYKGMGASSDTPDPKQLISEQFNTPYNASEDIPLEYQGGTIDQAYDRYADANPISGNFLKLKRILGRTLYGGQEK